MKRLYKVQHIGINNHCSLNIHVYMFHNMENFPGVFQKCGLFIAVAGLYIYKGLLTEVGMLSHGTIDS